jgi:lipopolysaccharide/colanic/teichoic acid biosynthesis glycosyltransferase
MTEQGLARVHTRMNTARRDRAAALERARAASLVEGQESGAPAEGVVREPRARIVGGGLKRAVDVTVAAGLLLVIAPALLLVALAVRLDSRGPALFRQHRGGLHGQAFEILKFRTMRVMEDGGAIVQAQRADPRVTRLGSFLRRSSIDELPQLVNVLRGDMSLVGPRPHALAHDQAFATITPDYALRCIARPGITGLAQISGARGPTQTREAVVRRTELDCDYVRRWSLRLDLLIIWRTAFMVLKDDDNAV